MQTICFRFFRIRCWRIATVAGLLLLTGCGGDGLNRTIISGNVTCGGEPVAVGQIRFIPQGGTAGPITIEPINNGRYRCERAGGVPAGVHSVEILSFDPTSPPPSGPGLPPRRQLLSTRYNRESQLTITIPADRAEIQQDFELD